MSPVTPPHRLVGPALLLLLLAPASAGGYEREEVAGHPGRYLFWSNRKITISVNERGCRDMPFPEAVGAIKRAFFAWASPDCTDVFFQIGDFIPAEKTNLILKEGESPDQKNLIVWHEDAWPPPGLDDPSITNKIPAITTLIYDPPTGLILDADLDLNGYDFFWTVTSDTTKAATDVESVIAHEAGHILGLAHSKEAEATMYGSVAQAELKKRTLEADDLAGVCFVYPFLNQTPRGPGQGTVSTPVEAGCEISPGPGPAGGRASLAVIVALVGLVLARRRRPR